MSKGRVVIVAAARTPIGTSGHAFANHGAGELAAPVLADLAARGGLRDRAIDEVVLGNVMGPGGNLARYAARAAGLGFAVPGVTVDRQCASGLAAVGVGAALIAAGAGVVLAGGVESASAAPWRSWPQVDGAAPQRYMRAPFAPSPLDDPDMGPAADEVSRHFGITRERADAYAARSHARAVEARGAGAFDGETVSIGGVTLDERPKPRLSVETLSRLRPLHSPAGIVTAGNSCGVNDGAAGVALVSGQVYGELGAPYGLEILAVASAGVDPALPGIGIVPAARIALSRASIGLDEVDVVEFNEAFAGQVLACADALGVPDERMCVEGGALALGHPWGASGAVLLVRLFSQLQGLPRGSVGLAGIAAGGGQGVAMVLRSCP